MIQYPQVMIFIVQSWFGKDGGQELAMEMAPGK